MGRIFLLPLFLIFSIFLKAQDTNYISIHQLQSEYFKKQPDSNFFIKPKVIAKDTEGRNSSFLALNKRVFGYHPYWAGNDYLNYHWDLLSDLCFFSYEVNPSNGFPLTTHDWENTPVIDSALANGTRVHLCVTLFSGHTTFFSNLQSQQTLIDQIIILLQNRAAQGVNIDVEALPASLSNEFTNFMINLCTQMDSIMPEAEVSIAAPAVNWSNKFNIPVLNQYIDFFMVMGYDYYWPGSSQAGASSPIYPMVGNYAYCFSRTISYYQSQGVSNEKIVMGVPYYAYQWPTQTGTAPSYTTGSGSAFTYSNVKNNTSGNYSAVNKHREPNSLSAYYAFQNGGWYQCFIEDLYSLSEKYETVNRRGLGGIGIWALGYDDGYSELWNLIGEYFTGSGVIVHVDTLYDSGGPGFDYFDDEAYTYTIRTDENANLFLRFFQLNLEQDYDTLWVYEGPDISYPLLNFFTGDSIPPIIESSSNVLTLRFYSDGGTTDAGWMAVYDTAQISSIGTNYDLDQQLVKIFPNPVKNGFTLKWDKLSFQFLELKILNTSGKLMFEKPIPTHLKSYYIQTENWPSGVYLAKFYEEGCVITTIKIIVTK